MMSTSTGGFSSQDDHLVGVTDSVSCTVNIFSPTKRVTIDTTNIIVEVLESGLGTGVRFVDSSAKLSLFSEKQDDLKMFEV